jgi:RNA recognition motif-containing protein
MYKGYNVLLMSHETSKLFVGGLPATTTHADLVKLFATAGQVFGVKIVMDRETNRSKGFAFVEMATEADAQTALQKLDGHKLVDRRIFITAARPLEKRAADPAKTAPKPAAFVERRSGKDRRAQPPAEAPRRKADAPSSPKKPAPNPGGFGPGFHPNKWKKPNRTRGKRPA